MEPLFVQKNSIVRKIWGNADICLFIFAGSAAEFALNKAVDWLYFTGRLPADPLGRLFSTVNYSRRILFSEEQKAIDAINEINLIHRSVEKKRSAQIPDWAYLDVLFMLIDYSVRSFEMLERPLSEAEKEEVFESFYRVGFQMKLKNLPLTYQEWTVKRKEYLQQDMVCSKLTTDLYKQYRKHLGWLRFEILKQVQVRLAPPGVGELLGLKKRFWLDPVLAFYKLFRGTWLEKPLKSILLPSAYKKQIMEMNIV